MRSDEIIAAIESDNDQHAAQARDGWGEDCDGYLWRSTSRYPRVPIY